MNEMKKPVALVVDDDRAILRAVEIRVRAAGYEVRCAGNGKAGLDLANEIHPDAVVLDLRMPLMDGLTVMRELKSHRETSDIPIIALSAGISERGRALSAGARYFLEKPFDASTLLTALESVIRDRRTPR